MGNAVCNGGHWNAAGRLSEMSVKLWNSINSSDNLPVWALEALVLLGRGRI